MVNKTPKHSAYNKFSNVSLVWFSLARIWLRLLCTVVQAAHCTVVLGHGDECRLKWSWHCTHQAMCFGWGRVFPGKQLLFLIHPNALYLLAEPWFDRSCTLDIPLLKETFIPQIWKVILGLSFPKISWRVSGVSPKKSRTIFCHLSAMHRKMALQAGWLCVIMERFLVYTAP